VKVWIIETGDYEQRYVFGIATSPEKAAAYIRSTYDEPYVIEWESLAHTPWGDNGGEPYDEYELVGHFSAVQGYSTEHTAKYTIHPCELIG
jgi:hypothetical protein